MPERQWGVAPVNDPTGSILRKATGISTQPDPSWSRKFLELVTGYPADPMQQTQPTDVMGAGLPFLGLLGAGAKVYHGTQKIFDKFSNKENDVNDVLGWLSHAAENPRYSESYASGNMKGIKGVDLFSHKPVSPEELKISGDKWYSNPNDVGKTVAPRTIPIQLHNKNTLDLVDPNPDDISHALASLDPYERGNLIQKFKDARRGMREGNYKEQFLPMRHYGEEDVPMNEVPVRHVAENLRMTPESFKKSPFDAIRYRDVNEKSWAFPHDVSAKTPWGTDVTNPPRDIKVIKTDKPMGGTLEVHPDRWDNPSDLAAQLKISPDMKLTGEQIEKLYYDNKITGKQKYDLYKNNVMSSSEQMAGFKPTFGYNKPPKPTDELDSILGPKLKEKYNSEPPKGNLTQSEVDDLLAKHQHGPIVQNTPNGPIKGKQTSEGHFIPDSKAHPKEWADKMMEINNYTDKDVNNMYSKGYISQNEYEALNNTMKDKSEKWLEQNKHLLKPTTSYDQLSKAVTEGNATGHVWNAYLKMLGVK